MLGIDYGQNEIITGEAAEWLYQEYKKHMLSFNTGGGAHC